MGWMAEVRVAPSMITGFLMVVRHLIPISREWTQHAWGDAIGDYMKTSQSAYDNVDGATSFYTFNSASPLTCSDMVSYGIQDVDGTYGRKLFYEARGYTVTDCYTQKTDNTLVEDFPLPSTRQKLMPAVLCSSISKVIP